MRTPTSNPFVPGSDHIPPVWAGRSGELADWRDVARPRRLAGEYERGRAILGEPGIGKSVLAARLSVEARALGDLVIPTVRIPRGARALALLADALADAVHREGLGETLAAKAVGLLDRVRSISAGVTVDLAVPAPAHPHLEITRLLVELGRLARHDGRAVSLHVDEIQNVTDAAVLSQLLVALGDALRHTDRLPDAAGNGHDKVLPLLVHVTGLPDFADRATSTAGATFARRFKPVLLTALSDADVRVALAPFTGAGWPVLGEDGPEAVVMTSEAVEAVVAACLGDPFLLQLAGKAAWDAGGGTTIHADEVRAGWSAVRREARVHVERSVERLPGLERALVEALAQLDPEARTLSRAAEQLGRRPADLATTARRLEDRGIIERGRPYAFTARTVEALLLARWP